MKKITWIQPYYDLILNMIPLNVMTVLDVGAGYGIFGSVLKKSRSIIVQAIEPFNYDLSHYDGFYKGTWKEFFKLPKESKLILDTTYDVLVSTEMIEHLEKTEAIKFLNETKEIADHVIIATPYNWEQQEAYDGNEFQKHKSHLSIRDFKLENYNVNLLGIVTKKGLTGRIFFHPKWLPVLRLIGVRPTNIIAEWKR